MSKKKAATNKERLKKSLLFQNAYSEVFVEFCEI